MKSNRSETRKKMQGLPDWISEELIEETIRAWQPHCDQRLTVEDALEIITNVGRLLDAISTENQTELRDDAERDSR